jgi:hypothetical protein
MIDCRSETNTLEKKRKSEKIMTWKNEKEKKNRHQQIDARRQVR